MPLAVTVLLVPVQSRRVYDDEGGDVGLRYDASGIGMIAPPWTHAEFATTIL